MAINVRFKLSFKNRTTVVIETEDDQKKRGKGGGGGETKDEKGSGDNFVQNEIFSLSFRTAPILSRLQAFFSSQKNYQDISAKIGSPF